MTNSHGNTEAAAANVADNVADGDNNTAFDELRAYVKQVRSKLMLIFLRVVVPIVHEYLIGKIHAAGWRVQ